MTHAIVQQLEGMEKLAAVKVLIAALHIVTKGMKAADLPGIVPIVQRLVLVKRLKLNQFTPAWEYLETVPTYDTVLELRKELVARFGEAGTPSKSHLHRYLSSRGQSVSNHRGRV